MGYGRTLGNSCCVVILVLTAFCCLRPLHTWRHTWLDDKAVSLCKPWTLLQLHYKETYGVCRKPPYFAAAYKCHHVKYFTRWAAFKAASEPRPHTAHQVLRKIMLEGLDKFVTMCESAGPLLTLAEAHCLAAQGKQALLALQTIHSQNTSPAGIPLRCRPKCHGLDHICDELAQGNLENPFYHGTWNEEGLLGHLRKIVQRCHFATATKRSMQRSVVLKNADL